MVVSGEPVLRPRQAAPSQTGARLGLGRHKTLAARRLPRSVFWEPVCKAIRKPEDRKVHIPVAAGMFC